jgi:C4-dicarboxylate-specific signal transduction histidine kinase
LVFAGYFIGVVIDEKQRVSRELRQTLRFAAAGEMASALAHELNQPLTALSAYGAATEHLLSQGETGSRLRETVHSMVAESFRAADVLRRLRDFFRTGATKLEKVALSDIIESASIPFVAKAKQQGIDLTIDPVPTCVLVADRLQLEVVIRNLLSNAFDAISDLPAGKRCVKLSSHSDGVRQILVNVEDSGPGLSEQMAEQIFDGFNSSKATGLGLGLAISRAIVQAHGGQLWAEPVGHGQFTLVLPTERMHRDAI